MSKLKWNGEFLGKFPPSVLICKWKMDKHYRLQLRLDDESFYCVGLATKNSYPCLVDEMKPIFGIGKRGSHRLLIGGTHYLIFYVPMTAVGEIVRETPLSEVPPDHPLRLDDLIVDQIRRIIVFREALAITSLYESSIILRPYPDGRLLPISRNETSTTIKREGVYDFSTLTSTILRNWFWELDFNTFVGRMIKREELSHLREEIEAVIKRIDSEYIWYSCFIVDRLMRRLF